MEAVAFVPLPVLCCWHCGLGTVGGNSHVSSSGSCISTFATCTNLADEAEHVLTSQRETCSSGLSRSTWQLLQHPASKPQTPHTFRHVWGPQGQCLRAQGLGGACLTKFGCSPKDLQWNEFAVVSELTGGYLAPGGGGHARHEQGQVNL